MQKAKTNILIIKLAVVPFPCLASHRKKEGDSSSGIIGSDPTALIKF